jgi:hypothetical protein
MTNDPATEIASLKQSLAEAEGQIRHLEQQRSSLAGMIMRMCRRLKRFDPETKVHDQATDLLKRYGLCSPLRADIGEVK